MLGVGLALAVQTGAWSLPAARPCSAAEVEALTRPVAAADPPLRLTCSARLHGRPILRRVLIEGPEASGLTLDCGGGSIGRPRVQTSPEAPTLLIRSRRTGPEAVPVWLRPSDVTIHGCVIHGGVRVLGMQGQALLASSRRSGHTPRAQAAAPWNIRFETSSFVGTGVVPLYLGIGVTRTIIDHARFRGRSNGPALYLDAESGLNVVTNSDFAVATPREQIALDGSADNRVVGNRFRQVRHGGVFLYRNCGEGGVIRHQTPSGNTVTDNLFFDAPLIRPRLVVEGSRQGRRSYCDADRGWPFGSSADDGDHATGNRITRNRAAR